MRHAGRHWGYAILILISIAALSVPMVLAIPDSGPGISSNAVNVSAADAYAIMPPGFGGDYSRPLKGTGFYGLNTDRLQSQSEYVYRRVPVSIHL